MTSNVLQHLDRNVLTISINNPERKNAMTREMQQQLSDAITRAATDVEVRAVLLRGAAGAFCAGGDVKRMASGAEVLSVDQKAASLRKRMETAQAIHDLPKPVVAMIDGAAAGAGLSLALACDLRIASDNAKITTAFAKVGLPGDFGGTYFMTKMLGSAKARELYFLSPVLSGKEAEAIGLVTRAVPEADLEKTALDLALSLAQGPTVTLGLMKKNLNNAENLSLAACFDLEALHQSLCYETADHKEASKAFVEKRKPNFIGR
jgi:2-(1,2-epoxy-1,2-dihydrophenyl)acetyl-CoA isomerase